MHLPTGPIQTQPKPKPDPNYLTHHYKLGNVDHLSKPNENVIYGRIWSIMVPLKQTVKAVWLRTHAWRSTKATMFWYMYQRGKESTTTLLSPTATAEYSKKIEIFCFAKIYDGFRVSGFWGADLFNAINKCGENIDKHPLLKHIALFSHSVVLCGVAVLYVFTFG